MVSYVTLGTNDFERAAKFYDALLADVGAKRLMENERIILWGSPGAALLAVCKPFDGKAASVGNGGMVALTASSPTARSEIPVLSIISVSLFCSLEISCGRGRKDFF